MKKRLLIVFALAAALTLHLGFTQAGETTADLSTDDFALTDTIPKAARESVQSEEPEQIYGVQLMTPEERALFRAKMSMAKTLEERDQIREENHKAMQERAESHGLTLPDQSPADMGGRGQGGGGMLNESGGMGHGAGMGSGLGRGQ